MRFVYVERGLERENKQCADILLTLVSLNTITPLKQTVQITE
jgi:hypothetical protein